MLAQPITDDDLVLVNACLELEHELRQRSYAAVERLLATVAGSEGNLAERVVALPEPDALRALGDLSDVGWIYGEPDVDARVAVPGWLGTFRGTATEASGGPWARAGLPLGVSSSRVRPYASALRPVPRGRVYLEKRPRPK